MPPTRPAPATRKRSAGGFLFGLFVGVVIGLGVSLMIAFYLNRSPVPFITAKAKPAEKDTKAPAIAGLPQTASTRARRKSPQAPGDPRPAADREHARRRAGEAEVRLLQDPARRGRAGHRARAARAAARLAQPARSTGSLERRFLHPGRVVPESGRRGQPEGAPPHP